MNILNYPMFFIFAVALIISAILTIVNKVLVDQDRLKEIQTIVKSYNKKLMAATKQKNQEELTRLTKERPKIMELQSEMMRMQMPVFASMLPFFVVFFLLRHLAVSMNWGEFVNLPFTVNFVGIGSSLSWLGWYILCSLPFTSLFRKVFGVH